MLWSSGASCVDCSSLSCAYRWTDPVHQVHLSIRAPSLFTLNKWVKIFQVRESASFLHHCVERLNTFGVSFSHLNYSNLHQIAIALNVLEKCHSAACTCWKRGTISVAYSFLVFRSCKCEQSTIKIELGISRSGCQPIIFFTLLQYSADLLYIVEGRRKSRFWSVHGTTINLVHLLHIPQLFTIRLEEFQHIFLLWL